MHLAEIGQDAPQRLVAVVVVLELLQRGQQRVPAALGDADGEQDEERIQAGLLDHHAVLGQVLGHQRGRDAGLAEAAGHIQARGDDRGLDRVQHVEAFGQVAEAVPMLVGLQDPFVAVADAFGHQAVRAPDLEPPVVLAEFGFHLAHGAAEVHGFADAFLDQRGASGRFHHGGGHVAGRDDRVLRRRGRVHQVRLVEDVAVQLAGLGLLHDDLRGLRDAGQQLVRGVRGEHHRVLAARAVLADGVHVLVELVERRVRQPGFVEVQRVDVAAELFLDHFDVVDHAIVGALRQRQDARVLVDGLTREGIGLDLLADVVRVEFFQRDRPDDAQVVARRTQKHRDRARHGDGVQDRLVAVAIHHDHVAGGDVGVPYHLVRSGRAVGHEVAVVGVEDARGVQLGLGHRAGVVQQLAQFIHGVADVGAQHVLAEELVEHLAHGALQEGHAAGVAGAVPGIRAVLRVLHQLAEERRRQAVHVAARFADDMARHELGRVLEHVDEAVQLAQDVVRDVLGRARLAVQVDRDVGVAKAQLADEGAQVLDRAGHVLGRVHVELFIVDRQDEGAGAALLLREGTQVAIAGHPDHLDALGLDRGGQGTDTKTGRVLGTVVLVDDENGEAEFHAGAPGARQTDAYKGRECTAVNKPPGDRRRVSPPGCGNGRIVGRFSFSPKAIRPGALAAACGCCAYAPPGAPAASRQAAATAGKRGSSAGSGARRHAGPR